MSAGERGTMTRCWSVAAGFGRRTMPTIRTRLPSTRDEAGIPAPGSPAIGTELRPTASYARHRSPRRRWSETDPSIETSRHSSAADGAAVSGIAAGPAP